ncbi:MAG: rhomboid family intramembrane serine protease [Sandaracinaceae bacterium]|nr:rhomboid family intramembrane serine protease [Sandaracinaceae bacterium]
MQSLLDRPVSITLVLIASCVAISLAGFYALSRPSYRPYFVFVPSRPGFAGTVLSHFAHGDLGHLFVNMLALFFFGPKVEHALGPAYYLGLYAASGAAATFTVYLLRRKNPRYSALGASGCIAGVMLATVVIDPTADVFLFFLPIMVPAPVFAVLYLVLSSIRMGGRDGVAHEAHLGGAIAGLALSGLLYERHFDPLVRAVTDLVR